MSHLVDAVGEIQSTPPFEEIKMRTFDTGATRDSDDDKLDYDGFLSPLVLRRYAEYLHKHRAQADGKKRDGDNWQKGIPLSTYMKSMWRHFMDFWTLHRGYKLEGASIEESLCAIIFNASGYLHELLKIRHPNKGRPLYDPALTNEYEPAFNEEEQNTPVANLGIRHLHQTRCPPPADL